VCVGGRLPAPQKRRVARAGAGAGGVALEAGGVAGGMEIGKEGVCK
jgi:hypothetical protein